MPSKLPAGEAKNTQLHVYVTPEQAARYAKAAARDKISVAEFARRAMDKEAKPKR
jgi:predicted HicB family RNase H-like nuclease